MDLDECDGPYLECRGVAEIDFHNVSGKLLYRPCVRVLNKKSLRFHRTVLYVHNNLLSVFGVVFTLKLFIFRFVRKDKFRCR